MKLHKKDQGTFGEALVVAQVIQNGGSAFPEFGDNSKIDLIVEDQLGKLHKVQVKTVGREVRTPDSSILYLYKSGPNYSFSYDESMIDWFAVVDNITQQIAWVKSTEALEHTKRQFLLRHKPPQKVQPKTRMFSDYTNYPF
jgi:hypothetical protein